MQSGSSLKRKVGFVFGLVGEARALLNIVAEVDPSFVVVACKFYLF